MEASSSNHKSFIPTGLRPPQIRVPKFNTENKENASEALPLPSLRRRSKSVTDLRKIENKSRNLQLLKPTGIKLLAPKSSRVESETHKSAKTSIATSKLRRRSCSVPQLHLINKVKPKTVNKPNTATKNKGLDPAKTVLKRKVPVSQDEVNHKKVKQAKIPSWDYKSRFNKVLDDFNTLNEEYKNLFEQVKEFNAMKEQIDNLKRENEDLQNKYAVLSQMKTALQEENAKLSKIKDLYLTLKDDYEGLVSNFGSLREQHSEISKENAKLSSELKICTEKNDDLAKECNLLKQDVYDGQVLRRVLHNTIQDLKGNIRVFCRVRPQLDDERLPCLINLVSERTMEIRKSRESITSTGKLNDLKAEFTFDRVFDSNCSQEEIFEDLSQLVQSALDGYNVCVFAYGQTGSGKTYTMQGVEDSNQAGLIPRTFELIFNSIDNLKRCGWKYEVSASFLEIYNETVRDLLNLESSQSLDIRYNEGKGTTVTNLLIQNLTSVEELKKLMNIAQANRAVAATNFNEHSSRSHAVTKIYLKGRNELTNVSYVGSINLVDLAGSESAKTSSGERMTETKNINRSLSTLGSVMLALYNKDKHIPYRNSKLTYLLQSSLGGNSKTLMIVNIAPFEDCFGESINSLRFAAKVKEVKMEIKKNFCNNR